MVYIKEKNLLEEDQRIVKRAENYNKKIVDYFYPFFGERILEVGCGFGHMTELFLGKQKVCSVDISRKFVSSVKKKVFKKNKFLCDAS